MGRILLVRWLNQKVVDPFLQIVRGGADPKRLAFSSALGITLGLFPICGVTVFLCGLAIALLGTICHAPSLMLANFVATPIELSLVVHFLRFGEVISGGDHFPLTSDSLRKVLTGQASQEILLSIFHAILGWLVASPFILGVLYLLFFPLCKHLVHKFSVVPSSSIKVPHVLSVHPHPDVKLKEEKSGDGDGAPPTHTDTREVVPSSSYKSHFMCPHTVRINKVDGLLEEFFLEAKDDKLVDRL